MQAPFARTCHVRRGIIRRGIVRHRTRDRRRQCGAQRPVDKFGGLYARYFDPQVDAIEQWPRDTLTVTRDARGAAQAVARIITKLTTGTGIHRGDELKPRRQFQPPRRARDGDGTRLERLAQ